jgi:hypothetical protein
VGEWWIELSSTNVGENVTNYGKIGKRGKMGGLYFETTLFLDTDFSSKATLQFFRPIIPRFF